MERIDLTEFSDQELSLQVFNDEALYSVRKEKWFLDFIKDRFFYTKMQLEILIGDLTDDDE